MPRRVIPRHPTTDELRLPLDDAEFTSDLNGTGRSDSQLTRSILPSGAPEELASIAGPVVLDKPSLLAALGQLAGLTDLALLKRRTLTLRQDLMASTYDVDGDLPVSDATTVSLRLDVLISQLDQITGSFTLERAQYYLKRLCNGITHSKTGHINDINLARWKEYDDIITDSLWVVDKRDTSGAHLGWYWGNFIPQIPHQMMLRYTKSREWVLDAFMGSGTTLIECRRLGRNGIGIELNPKVAQSARELVRKEANLHNVTTDILMGDSRTIDIASALGKHGISKVQLLIMHPPYHDIIKFSNEARDLSNAPSTETFLTMFGEVVDNATPFLDDGRFCAVVIGDKYSKGEWIPLGFCCMDEVLRRGYLLKSIVVKNFDETRAKRNQKELWRYRALVGGFYVFKHEYVMLFQKRG